MRINEGLVIFVTGGSGGLGEATVFRLHSQGAKIAVADLSEKAMEAMESKLRERILCIKCDVSKESDVKHAIDKTIEKFGTIHVALTCAGIASPTPTLTSRGSLDTHLYDKVIQINLYGSVYVAKYASIAMSKNKPMNDVDERGVILFVSSNSASQGSRGHLAYSASKGAINGMVMPMARDLGRYGIRVVAIQPGLFDTAINNAAGLMQDEKRR